jgi:hypothetical protein
MSIGSTTAGTAKFTTLNASGATRFTNGGSGSSATDSSNAVNVTGTLGVSANIYAGNNMVIADGMAFYIGNSSVLNSTTLGSNIVASSLTSVGTLTSLSSGAISVSTSGSGGSITITDTGTNGGNIKLVGNGSTTPNKTIRAYNGLFQVLNSAYNGAVLTVTDAGLVQFGVPSLSSNLPTSNAITMNSNGYIYDDGNFHLHSSSGALWINTLDSSAIRIGTQYNSGSGGYIVVQNGVQVLTNDPAQSSFFPKVQTGYNVNSPAVAMDNLNVRLSPTGGSNLLMQASAVSGSFVAYTTIIDNIAGSALRGDTNSGGITFTAGTWTSVNAYSQVSSGGDMLIVHVIDTTNSRVYRVTAIHTGGTTNGFIAIERMV